MARKLVFLLLLVVFSIPCFVGVAQLPVDVPREEVFVVDALLRAPVPNNHNYWITGPWPGITHALTMDTLWIRDQETGERVKDVAISDPMYNDDFTQMSVDLRDNIYWSDGVQFTADDLIFTVETLKANPDLNAYGWSANLNKSMASVEKTGDFSVTFHLTEPTPRFHVNFEARWSGVYMMPKHVFENIDDLAAYTYQDGPVLGAYTYTEEDPNGMWQLLTRRDDWERSPAGVITGNPGPKYILEIFYGDSARKVIAMSRGELDVYENADFEAFQGTLETAPTARSWYADFPWAYPNEVSSRNLIFNFASETQPWFREKDVRWALTLAMDNVELLTEYIGGVSKVTNMPVPATNALSALYHDPMEEWFQNLEIEIEEGVMIQPYDPTVPDQVAAWAEGEGLTVPGDARAVFGTGWWAHAPDVSERLLMKHGFSRDDGGNWLTPDGDPWEIEVLAPVDDPDGLAIANAAADMWNDFGIDVRVAAFERSLWRTTLETGQFDINASWFSFVLASGDAWPQFNGWHPDLIVPIGEDARTTGGRPMRLADPKIGEFIDAMVPINPDDPRNFELTTELFQYWVENMYSITTISFKKFVTWNEQYWTGFPTFENPTSQPLFWFQGGKLTFQNLKPVGS